MTWLKCFIVICFVALQSDVPDHNTGKFSPESPAPGVCVDLTPGFLFLKTFSFACEPETDYEFSYVLVKRSRYSIRLCAEETLSSVQIALFNSYRDRLAFFTVSPENGNSLVYESAATGIYYIKVLNAGNDSTQGRVTLSFQRMEDPNK